jgi:heme-degrading monooxygenase HmoA
VEEDALTERIKGVVLADGANEFDGLVAMLQAAKRWPQLRREMVGAPGYLTHHLWFSWPTTVGILSWWEDEASAYRFAHQPAHLEFWEWATRRGHTRGGWLAFYPLGHGGPLWGNGVQKRVTTFRRFTAAPTGAPPKATPRQRRSLPSKD